MLELVRYIHLESDERILGDCEFTQSVLDEAKERLEEHYWLQAQGYDLDISIFSFFHPVFSPGFQLRPDPLAGQEFFASDNVFEAGNF